MDEISRGLILGTPLFWPLVLMTILNITLSVTPVIKISISKISSAFAEETASQVIKDDENDENSEASHRTARDFVMHTLGSRRPFGSMIGLIERQLYLFALTTRVFELITAILLFKAFYIWLDSRNSTLEIDKSKLRKNGKSLLCLAKYYNYATGNFLSLIWAIVIFELGWLIYNHSNYSFSFYPSAS